MSKPINWEQISRARSADGSPLFNVSPAEGLAKAIQAVKVQRVDTCMDKGQSIVELVVDCRDFDHYKLLPDVVSFEGAIYGKTGWNSDNGAAYYRNAPRLAYPL